MKYENQFGKVKITLEQLLTLFENKFIDVSIINGRNNKHEYTGSLVNLPADFLTKYVEQFDVRFDTNHSPYKFKCKVTVDIIISDYTRRVNVWIKKCANISMC